MSFARPTLSELVNRAKADIDARLPGADSRLSRSALGVLATTSAGAAHGLYGYLDHIARQQLPDTADADVLERHAQIWGLNRKAATLAAGAVTATGADGAVIPAGTLLQRPGGLEYETTAAAVIAGGTASLQVAARAPGLAGVAEAGVKLTFVSPIAGVAALALVAGAGLAGGAEEESDELLRERLLARIRKAPEGGALHDYVNWTMAVPEVSRAWVFPGWTGAGTVGVAFMMDGRDDPFPEEVDVDAVAEALEPLRPVTAEVVVFAPTPKPIDVEIASLDPNNPAVRAAVEAELRDLLFREASPGGTILLSHLREAVSQAAGEWDHVLVAPAANVPAGPGELAVLGALTWS